MFNSRLVRAYPHPFSIANALVLSVGLGPPRVGIGTISSSLSTIGNGIHIDDALIPQLVGYVIGLLAVLIAAVNGVWIELVDDASRLRC